MRHAQPLPHERRKIFAIAVVKPWSAAGMADSASPTLYDDDFHAWTERTAEPRQFLPKTASMISPVTAISLSVKPRRLGGNSTRNTRNLRPGARGLTGTP